MFFAVISAKLHESKRSSAKNKRRKDSIRSNALRKLRASGRGTTDAVGISCRTKDFE